MTMVVIIIALVALAVVVHAGADAIAYGRRPHRRPVEALRAEDAVEEQIHGSCDKRQSADEAISATLNDRKLYDLSGLGGLV